MELYYNPEQMPAAEIKQTFVGRGPMLKELLDLLRRQPRGAGVQHVLLIGARGMGKTTMLLMLRLAVLDGDLRKKWQPVRFPEESYAITDLADFWLAAIRHLACETGDTELAARGGALQNEFKPSVDLAGAALATLKDWSRQHGKRLLLLVDNLDMVLNQIGNRTENARLRDALMNDGTFMLVGGATSFFHEARSYDQPLYNFFKTWNLDALDDGEMNQLLLKRAEADQRTDFEHQLKQNETRLKVLHYFTGGNPRLVLMLYRIIASSDLVDVRRGLEKLLDEVTPYYKAKIESLPPQQRKILDHIARISARTGSGLTPTEIAAETRLPVNQVTSQLKRLSLLGYVRAANVRARSSWYSLAEPLYAIWHQMRFGRESPERMAWLVEFLRTWYSNRELLDETENLTARPQELVRQEEPAMAATNDRHMDVAAYSLASGRLVPSNPKGVVGPGFRNSEVNRRRSTAETPEARLILLIATHNTSEIVEALDALAACARLAPSWLAGDLPNDWIPAGLRRFHEMRRVICSTANETAYPGDETILASSVIVRGDLEEAVTICRIGLQHRKDPVLQRLNELLLALRHGPEDQINLFALLVAIGALPGARAIWNQKLLGKVPSAALLPLAWGLIDDANLPFLRTLIRESNLDDELLPLVVAMDYLETGDRAPLEKLSAEIRPIAEQIVAELQKKLSKPKKSAGHSAHEPYA